MTAARERELLAEGRPPNRLQTIVTTIDTVIGTWPGRLVALSVIPMILGLVYEVGARLVFHAPTSWSYDATYMLYGSHFMLGATYTLYKRQHLRMARFYETLSVRGQGIVDTLFYLLIFFPSMSCLMVVGWDEAWQSWAIGERAGLSSWSPLIYPFKFVLPTASALLLLQGVSELLKSGYAATQGRSLSELKSGLMISDHLGSFEG